MLLAYDVPNRPTAGRVFVWRKLKKLGAVLTHGSLWILPATPQTREQLRWLAAEIAELNGQASVWESQLTFGDEDGLIRQFCEAVEPGYSEILTNMKQKDRNLAAMSRRYQQLQAQDYFSSKLGQRVRNALIAAKGGNR
jgi:hypothetical protein